MREILFRGKRVEKPIKIEPYAPDGWVYGDLIICDDGHFILPHDISGEMYIDRPYKFRANDVEARVMLAKVGENTTGQYTGLTDKNGTKIFEGDIVKMHQFLFDGGEYEKEICGVITYNNETMCYCLTEIYNFELQKYMGYERDANGFSKELVPICYFYGLHEESWEVIGNICDNPELLKNE